METLLEELWIITGEVAASVWDLEALQGLQPSL
jgi:hypothetical protein